IKPICEDEEWEDVGDLAQALGHLFLHKDLPPLLEFPYDPLIESPDEQLLLLNKLEIQEPESPYHKGHFIDDYLWLAEEVQDISLPWEGAFSTIRVLARRCPIYTVTLIYPVGRPSLLMSLSPYQQVFNQDCILVSPSSKLLIHCFMLTLEDGAPKKN